VNSEARPSSTRTSSEVTIAAAFSLMVAILFTGSAIFAMQKSRIFAASAVAANAEVVEVVKEKRPASSPSALGGESESSASHYVMVPIFQYKVDGAVFERRAEVRHMSKDTIYSVGDTTTIYYNPENPSEIRDVLKPEASTAPSVFGGMSAIAWFLFAAFSIHSFRLMRYEARNRVAVQGLLTETKCAFVALEATTERVQNARMIRVVCRWVHPETGVEWLLRTPSLHPTTLPSDLELGTMVSCEVDFDNPTFHVVSLQGERSSGEIMPPGLAA
jgi:hypothetical protein